MTEIVLVLSGGTVIDGTGAPPMTNADVVVTGRQISAIGPGAGSQVHGAVRYDAAGTILMPGLIDCHVHLLSNAGDEVKDIHLWNVLTPVEEQTLHAAANARRALLAGVTTVRDMAGSMPEVAVKHVMDDHVFEGARVVCSGFVGMTAGHGDMFCPPAIERRLWKPVDGPDECRKLVREYARMGVDFIKICTSGGVLSMNDKAEWRNFTMEEACVIVDEAHALGKRVAAHAHSQAGIRMALEAGVDTLEHGTSLDDELVEMMLKHDTWLCPTIALSEYMLLHGEQRGIPADSMDKARAMRSFRQGAIRRAHEAGVPIIMGTDSCNTMAFGSHAWELELMHEYAGLTPMECLIAATRDAARAIGLGEETGTLEVGKWADLLVVDGDPLSDLVILQRPERLLGIFRDGRLTDPGSRMERLRSGRLNG